MDVSANFGQLKDHHGVWDALTLEVEGARHMCTTPLAHTSSLHGVNNSTKPHSFHWPYRTHKCSPHLLWGWSNIASSHHRHTVELLTFLSFLWPHNLHNHTDLLHCKRLALLLQTAKTKENEVTHCTSLYKQTSKPFAKNSQINKRIIVTVAFPTVQSSCRASIYNTTPKYLQNREARFDEIFESYRIGRRIHNHKTVDQL